MPDTRRSYAFQLRIAVSYYCNQRCRHCYVPELNRVEYKHRLEESQLAPAQIENFIDLLISNFRLEKISITGGETLLNIVWPRTRRVMQHALRKGLTVQLNTNGAGQVSLHEVIEAAGSHLDQLIVQVSLDGLNEKHVDEFRGFPGAMRRSMETIRQGVSGGAYVRVRYSMTEDNYQDAVACYEQVDAMGAAQFVIKPAFSAGSARDNPTIITTGNVVREIQQRLVARSVGRRMQLDLAQPVFVDPSSFPAGANVNVINCACGKTAAYLSTTGDIYPCMYLVGDPGAESMVLGNIKDPSFDFARVWNKPDTFLEFRTGPRDGNCTAQNVLARSSDELVQLRPQHERPLALEGVMSRC